MPKTTQEQLADFLNDMYSVEQQALAQMVSAPDMAGDPVLAAAFRLHYAETQQQAELVQGRLEAHGGSPSALKDAIMKLGGKGFLLFAKLMPETPGRLVAHAYSYEAMEWAGYEMLRRFAEAAGDTQTGEVATTIGDQERAMMERLEQGFDAAEQASHRDKAAEKMGGDVQMHLNEAHALESQAIHHLTKSTNIAGDPELGRICSQNLHECEKHAKLIEQRLKALGSSTSTLKDTALALGGWNWGFFFQAQADTPSKLAAFVYAFEHLKIAGYELLKRSARRAGDAGTEELCEALLTSEQAMVADLAATFDSAATATLAAVASK